VPLPTKQHGVGISAHGHAHTHPMQPWASRPRRQKRLVVRRAILSEQLKQQEEQEPATAASESDAQSSSEALPNPINTGPLLHGFLEAWICIHQAHPGGPAEVYEHSSPMNDAVWAGLQRDHVQPVKLMTVHQRSFRSCTDVQGPWSNFRVRLSRGFSPFEEMTMFPNRVQLLNAQSHSHNANSASNTCTSSSSSSRGCLSEALKQAQVVEVVTPAPSPQASSSNPCKAAPSVPAGQTVALDSPGVQCHCQNSHCHSSSSSSSSSSGVVDGSGNSSSRVCTSTGTSNGSSSDALQVQRRCHNARSLSDLVQLLADPTETGVLAHLANAGRTLSYRPRRIWDCLKARWGAEALHTLGFTPRTVHRLLHQGVIYNLAWQDELQALHHYRVGGSSSRSSSSSGSGRVDAGAQQQRQEEERIAAQQAVKVRAANQRASSLLQAAAL